MILGLAYAILVSKMSEHSRRIGNGWLVAVFAVLVCVIVGLSVGLIILNNKLNDKASVECTSVVPNIYYGEGGDDYARRLTSEIENKIDEETDNYVARCAVDDYKKALETNDERTRFYVAVEYANFLVEEDDVEGALKFFDSQEWDEFMDIEMKITYYETMKSLFEVNGMEEEATKYDAIIDSLYEEIGDTPIDIMEDR